SNNEDIDISNTKIIELVTKSIGKGTYRPIKEILAYLIPVWLEKGIIKIDLPIIHIRISGDEVALNILITDLNSIKDGYKDQQGRQWQIKLYFSADWKMLALCLGHKATNSDHFCLWCCCSKNENGNLDLDWTIQKNIEKINENYMTINGHKKKPLFSMIPLTNWDHTTTANQFKTDAITWLRLFLTKSSGEFNKATFTRGLYRPNDITPYIHVMVYHLPEFIDSHRCFGIDSFSCAAVEKKNNQQVSYFFKKTLKDGEHQHTQKAAILEILDYDNR
ncbi:21067_t:CDS:2, partial [Cetraspora pellucida]